MSQAVASAEVARLAHAAWIARWEAAFEDVLRHVELTEGFAFFPVEVESRDVVQAMAGWLGERGAPCDLVVAHDNEAWEELGRTLADLRAGTSRAVVVSGPNAFGPPVTQGLRLLNQRRDAIAAQLGRPLLWCGPAEFLRLTAEHAPDLWSIRELPLRLAPSAPAKAADATSAAGVAATRSLAGGGLSRGDEVGLAAAARAQGDWRNAAIMEMRAFEGALAHNDTAAAEASLQRAEAELRGEASGNGLRAVLNILRGRLAATRRDVAGMRAAVDAVDPSALPPELVPRWLELQGGLHALEGDRDGAMALAIDALDEAARFGPGNVPWGARFSLIGGLLDAGRLEEAESAARQILICVDRGEIGESAATFAAWVIGSSLARRDRFDEAAPWLRRALFAKEHIEPRIALDAALQLVRYAQARGDYDTVLEVSQVALRPPLLVQDGRVAVLRLLRVGALLSAGRGEEARALYDAYSAEFDSLDEDVGFFLDAVRSELGVAPLSPAALLLKLHRSLEVLAAREGLAAAAALFEQTARNVPRSAPGGAASFRIWLAWNALIRRGEDEPEHRMRAFDLMAEGFDVLGDATRALDARWLACACASEAHSPRARDRASYLRERIPTFTIAETGDMAAFNERFARVVAVPEEFHRALVESDATTPKE